MWSQQRFGVLQSLVWHAEISSCTTCVWVRVSWALFAFEGFSVGWFVPGRRGPWLQQNWTHYLILGHSKNRADRFKTPPRTRKSIKIWTEYAQNATTPKMLSLLLRFGAPFVFPLPRRRSRWPKQQVLRSWLQAGVTPWSRFRTKPKRTTETPTGKLMEINGKPTGNQKMWRKWGEENVFCLDFFVWQENRCERCWDSVQRKMAQCSSEAWASLETYLCRELHSRVAASRRRSICAQSVGIISKVSRTESNWDTHAVREKMTQRWRIFSVSKHNDEWRHDGHDQWESVLCWHRK